MDGASKFVRGDAVAGLIITGINMLGGLIIGVFPGGAPPRRGRGDLHLAHGGRRAGQPAPSSLLISAAAGIIVTRAAGEQTFGEHFGSPVFGKRSPWPWPRPS